MTYSIADIPDQSGKLALVTGANSGLGYETAYALAHAGADVLLGARSEAKGQAAVEKILASKPKGSVTVSILDLNDLDLVKAYAAEFVQKYPKLDILVANAGVMLPNPPSTTAQGHEVQFGVNHLAHAALIGLLFPLLRKTEGSRVVTVASFVHKDGRIDFDDLDWKKRSYSGMGAYQQSKLANLLWAQELARRSTAAKITSPTVTLAHPGWSLTELQRGSKIVRLLSKFLAQDVKAGALPQIYAATQPGLEPGSYWGPQGFKEFYGNPGPAKVQPLAGEEKKGPKLFDVTEELTGVKFDFN